MHRLQRPLGIAREADGDEHIIGPDAQHLLKGLPLGGPYIHHILKDVIEVEGKEPGQHPGGAQAKNINAVSTDDGINDGIEVFGVYLLLRAADLIGIGGHDPVQDIHAAGKLLINDLHALYGGQPVADDILQGFLQLGIALKAQFGRKAHHGGFTDPHRFAQLGGGHEGRFIVMLQDKSANALLPLGKALHLITDQLKQILRHT